jgi:hypothetical protein
MWVPVVVTPPPPSPEAQELGQRIANLVREHQAGRGRMSGRDVLQSFQVARTLLRSEIGGSPAAPGVLVALLLGLLALGAGALFFFSKGGGAPIPAIGLLILVIGVGAALVALVASRR